jgi:predicted metal-binding membrane protein
MSAAEGHTHPVPGVTLPPITWPILAAAAAIVAAAWAVTLATSAGFNALLMMPLGAAAPAEAAAFVALSGVMMVAMMLPSALPMLEAHRGLVKIEAGSREAFVESAIFGFAYLVSWTAMTAFSLVALTAFGVMGTMGGAAAYAAGAILVGAGVYQFTSWKEYCLRHCRSPIGFITTHYQKGRAGALRMGFSHASYCLGCCWLLMLVWFVAGAMSVLWMGVFAAFILAEKVLPQGKLVSRAMGFAAVAAGALSLYLAAAPAAM